MSDNFQITQGSGTTIAAHQNVDLSLEQKVQVTVIPAITGTVSVSNFPTTQPISGTVTITDGSGPVTVDGSVSVSNFPGSQAVTGTFFQGTQPVSIATMPTTPVTGTFFQATQPVSLLPANLSITATGAAAAAVTATLPAVAGQFHYITGIEIEAYSTVARTGSATPVLVTSTNLPGNNVFTFASAAAIGTSDTKLLTVSNPYKSSVVNTATTIVCPATTSVIWRINIYYFSAA